MNITLVVFKQTGERRDLELSKETALIGRNSDSDFHLPLAIISRRHCQLSQKNGTLKVRDLGSSNGTYVNGRRIQETELHAGDTLTVGPVTFTIVIDGEPKDVTPTPTARKSKKAADSAAPATTEQTVELGSDGDSVDLSKDDSGALDFMDSDDSGPTVSDPIAALEAMSKKKS
jgi:pSer/pThr/pTyr-binding forkhead associated (FHA) protein